MRRFPQKALAVVLCCAMLLSALPAVRASAAGDGTVTCRALLIGNAKYDSGQTLQAPAYDAEHMEQLLLQQDFSGRGFAPSDILTLNNATKLQILDTITDRLAPEADGDDVTYFYYSGHGSFDGATSYLVGSDMSLISIDELKAALDKVPGRKVVILDSCYSGGYAGKGAGSATPQGSVAKDTGADSAADRKAAGQANGLEGFQAGVLKPFEKPQGGMLRAAALTTSSYEVIAAASAFQYSYEYQFNSKSSGSPCYGPEFYMNGKDYAGGPNNCSGEFTGMLVAAAGCVTFNPVFPEVRALADADRDRKVTLDELYRYLRGAVLYSTVQVYPENSRSVVFERSAADTPDWGQPALYAYDNAAPHAPGSSSPIRFGLLSSPDWQQQVTIHCALKIGDNRYADNAGVDISDVAEVPAEQAPAGSEATALWDGTASDGRAAGDGWYYAQISSGAYKYPPVPFELSRGVSNFPEATALPMGKTFSASLAGAFSKRWYSFTPSASGLFRLQSVNGGLGMDPEAELFDSEGDSLAWSGDITLPSGDNDCNFELLRYLQAGQTYYVCITLDDGSDASLSVFSRFTALSPNNAPTSVDASRTAYTLFRPDTSGMWTIKAKSTYDDGNPGITLYDTWFDPVAYGERSPESYRYLCTYLEAGRTYILETPEANAPMQVAAYGPGKAPAVNTSLMAALTTSAGASVSIAHEYDTKYFRFTPASSGIYRFRSSSPVEGASNVDSYAFLLDGKGAVIASDDDVNLDQHKLQFDFSAALNAGTAYALAVRAYVTSGQLSAKNPTLDFTVYASETGSAAQTQAVSTIAAGSCEAAALYDNDGSLSGGIGSGGLLSAWGASVDPAYDGLTGYGFGEGLSMLRRWTPELLYAPGLAFTRLWSVGGAFVAKGTGSGYYAWGDSNGDVYGTVSRLDSSANGLAQYDITYMAQGADQDVIYFLDGTSGRIYSMEDLTAAPSAVTPAGTRYAKIAVSDGSLFALDSSGALWAEGTNRYGECGTGDTNSVGNLTKIYLPESNVDFASGGNHTVALGADGRVFAWGCNDSGSVGLGRTDRVVAEPSAVSFVGLLSSGEKIMKVFAGGGCSAALTSSGRVFAWGANGRGQLGMGSTFSQDGPAEVKALAPSSLGSGRKVVSLVFGPESSYAIASDGSVYVSGRNDYGQLGFLSDDVHTFTLFSKPNIKSSNDSLVSLRLSAGTLSPAFSPQTLEYSVIMPRGVAYSTVTAAKADTAATMTIDGKAATSKTVNAGPGPVKTQIKVTAPDGSSQTYVLNFPQSPSSNDFLSALTASSGCPASALNRTATNYTVVIPETVAGPVTFTPVLEDSNSSYVIDGTPGLKSKTLSLALNQTATMRVEVTAQTGGRRAYTFTVARKALLSGFSGSPVYAGSASLSPGGTDRLSFRYALAAPATVKIEVKKGTRWYALLNRAEASAGANAFAWDGKVGGRTLSAGTYQVRITPYYDGKAGGQRTMDVKILPRPAITVYNFYPSTFTVNGRDTLRVNFRWSRIADVKAVVLNSRGKPVKTIISSANRAPQTLLLRWDGRGDSGALLPAGSYTVRIVCGGSTLDMALRIKR